MTRSFDGARILILGGTGSLGQRLFARLLDRELGTPESVTIFSRDEAKQHYMRLNMLDNMAATDDVIYHESAKRARFAIGDVRNVGDLRREVDRSDVIFHAAALKQVPTCEYYGAAAVDTNVYGAINLCAALRHAPKHPRTVVGISTDKACKPVNLMGMTKAIQERILAQANMDVPECRFVNVRYGNVMASRGSAIPFFIDVVRKKKPVPITDMDMTRFLMTLDQSVDLIFQAYLHAHPGETYLPMVPCAKIVDVVSAVAENDQYPTYVTGVRPGEKLHEILVSEEERPRAERRNDNIVIRAILPELRHDAAASAPIPFEGEYTSAQDTLTPDAVAALLRQHGLTVSTAPIGQEIYR